MRKHGSIAATMLVTAIAVSATAGPGDRPPPPNPNIQILFGTLTFRIRTGGDDLRSDSEAWIELRFRDGGNRKCELKDIFEDTWDNGTLHEPAACTLSPARSMNDLRGAQIVLRYDGSPFPTDPLVTAFHTLDNWDVREVHIAALTLTDNSATCLLDQSGDPLTRLSGEHPGFLLTPLSGCR